MATPNPSHHKPAPTPRPPTSASAMTPASISASSPAAPPSGGGHRSHPSPAAFSSTPSSTSKMGKSPLNHLQQMQLLASTNGGQMMSRSGTNTSSPGSGGGLGAFAGLNAMLMMNGAGDGGTKTGLTPAGEMGLGVSPLPDGTAVGDGGDGGVGNGYGSTTMMKQQQRRDQEEERRIRLENIVALLGQRWGHVSREGVERCARRVGLECLWEDQIPGVEDRTLSIAGNSVLLDVLFLKSTDEVGTVSLSFPGREEGVWGKSAELGADVLRKNLKDEGSEYRILDPFVESLGTLARLDRLGTGGINCFDAIGGVGNALRRVWESEKKQRRDTGGEDDIETTVMCKQSGKPTMHAKWKIGLAVQYWMERQHLSTRKRKRDDMDIDDAPAQNTPNKAAKIWSLAIECEPSSAETYPSIRVSEDWISDPPIADNASAPDDQIASSTTHSIQWQDPPLTFLTPDPASSSLLDTAKTPDIRFAIQFNPPLLVPLQTALQIYTSVGSHLPATYLQDPKTYTSLVLPDHTSTPNLIAHRDLHVPSPDDGEMKLRKHKYTLFTPTQPEIYAANIASLPFSHPRQIINLLPTLRRWAFLSTVLRNSFTSPLPPTTKPDTPIKTNNNEEDDDDELHALLSPPTTASSPNEEQATAIDISLSLSTPKPSISVVFPYKEDLASITLEVGLNGEVEDVEVDVGDFVDGEGGEVDGRGLVGEEAEREGRAEKDADRQGRPGGDTEKEGRAGKVKRVLEMSEDLGVVVEWTKR